MPYRKVVLFCLCAALLLTIMGCTKPADVAGKWSGDMSGTNAGKKGSTRIETSFDQDRRGISGTVTCRNSTGAWDLLDGNTLTIQSSKIAGDQVSFVASVELPGGSVTMNLKGKAEGATIKGTADVTIGSVMGGNTYLGDFELAKK